MLTETWLKHGGTPRLKNQFSNQLTALSQLQDKQSTNRLKSTFPRPFSLKWVYAPLLQVVKTIIAPQLKAQMTGHKAIIQLPPVLSIFKQKESRRTTWFSLNSLWTITHSSLRNNRRVKNHPPRSHSKLKQQVLGQQRTQMWTPRKKCPTFPEWPICNLGPRDATSRATLDLWKSHQEVHFTKNQLIIRIKISHKTDLVRWKKKLRRLAMLKYSRWKFKSSCIKNNKRKSMRHRTSSRSSM